MKIFENYQHNAWGRRMARDYSRMPRFMKLLFVSNHYVSKFSVFLLLIILASCFVCMSLVIQGTWLTGGKNLLSESFWLLPACFLFAAAIAIRWIIPGFLNFIFTYWYETTRSKF